MLIVGFPAMTGTLYHTLEASNQLAVTCGWLVTTADKPTASVLMEGEYGK